MLRVCYEKSNDQLSPEVVLIQADIKYNLFRVDLNGPYECILFEDIADLSNVLPVTKAAIAPDYFQINIFQLEIEEIKNELYRNKITPDEVYKVDFFMISITDLEEILNLELKEHFKMIRYKG